MRLKNKLKSAIGEAALKIGVSDRHLRLLLARGEIEGIRLGHDWVVLSLDYKKKRGPKKNVVNQS